ncbi:MAG: magnesium chelatase subunit [Methanoculleus sp.]|uniref:magnesium chelatase subunit D family protein n=1 Tax=Methanoculleus sp. TaxID=90427 RepID=UPI00074A830C|nr:magnesium chelatase subunit D family protein [Methanoculleus sp.]KUL00245.1 MAG: Magnesium chelatase subunit D [Methanomicrobiales archaeon 53_19]MDK2889399.1 magnesium chelatase subunit [Methanoculleus sp.]
MSYQARRNVLPFTAIVGQETMKRALILNAVNQGIGGVLIRGEKGTAKSTAVRALADVLPEIDVIRGCPYSCDPAGDDGMCTTCAERKTSGDNPEVERRRVRVIDLPLGVTEDRVVGTVDVERAIREGKVTIDPGILAAVNRGILYIDEVNLLDDHVADVLLDAAAMGVNVVEREGISFSHPARFILVGTMNPEEGELRPQLLDRFGLQVTVEGIADTAERVAIIRAAEAFERDPGECREAFRAAQEELREKIADARVLLPSVTADDDLLNAVAEACVRLGVRTHRADIAVVRTAKTIAALDGRTAVTRDDVREAMELALPHRMRRKPFEEPRIDPEDLDRALDDAGKKHGDSPRDGGEQGGDERPGGHDGEPPPSPGGAAHETVFPVGNPVDVRKMNLPERRDTLERLRPSGRRLETFSARNMGRYVSARYPTGTGDVALDATLRAAAPHQSVRDRKEMAVTVRGEDIRERVRVGKVSVACVFVVDASGSMGATRRMESAKGAVLSMLLDSYRHRDRVGLVAFRGNSAETLLPLSSSVDLAQKQLEDLPTGGKTPLCAGLMKGMEVLLQERRKNGEVIPMMVVISDGRANVPVSGDVRHEVLGIAEEIQSHGIRTVVIDTEETGGSFLEFRLGYCRAVAEHAGGGYYPIADLSAGLLQEITAAERDAMVHPA